MHVHPLSLLAATLLISGMGHASPSPVNEAAELFKRHGHHPWACLPGYPRWPQCNSWVPPPPTSSQTPAPSQTQDPIEPVDPTISTDPTPTEVVGPTLTAYPSQPASGSNTTSAFGNVHYKYSNQPSGTINLSPCTIGKGIVFKLALDGSIATVQNDKVRIGKKKGVAEAQWLVSSGKGVLEGTVAFQNNATKQYLRRVPIQTGGDPSPLLVTQYTVDAQGLSVDTNSIWTCERMRFIGDIDKSSTSYFTWLIGGGKGQFLGRPAHNATTLEPVYSLVQASPEIDDGNMVDGRIVFGDLIEVFDHNA